MSTLNKKYNYLKKLTLADVLHIIDFSSKVIIYVRGDERPLWEGYASEIPYWIAESLLDFECEEGEDCFEPISFRHSLGEEYKNQPGFVITIRDIEE
jgi:hypothetical protein